MKKNNWFKYIISFLTVFAVRLIPFRAPNLEPVMATIMPIGKAYKGVTAFLFGSLSIVLFDLVTSGLGIWTLVTAFSYGLIGLGSVYYFRNRSGWKNYALYAIIATLVYDLITGVLLGPALFGMSFTVALVGQIPFTVMHLLGNTSFAIVLSPVLERWLVKNEESLTVSKVLKVS